MVACFYGLQTDLAALRRRFDVSLKGVTLADLVRYSSDLHLVARPVKLELEGLLQLRRPCILHWDMSHFVVLVDATSKYVTVNDPAAGIRRMQIAELAKHFTGVALELTPGDQFVPARESHRISFALLLGKVIGLKRGLSQIFLLSLSLEVFGLLAPLMLQWTVDHALVVNDRELLMLLACGFLLLVVIREAVGALRSWVVTVLGTDLNLQWTANVLAHLFRLPIPFFERRHLGDVVSRFASIQSMQRTLTTGFVVALLDGVMAGIGLLMMYLYSAKLASIALGVALIYVSTRMVFYRPLRTIVEEQIVHSAKQQSHFLESVRGVQSLKLYSRESLRQATYLNLAVNTVNRDLAAERLRVLFKSASGLLRGVEGVVIIWVGAVLVMNRDLSVGMLLAFIAYKDQFSTRVSSLADQIIELRMLGLQGERLADIVLTPPEADEPLGGTRAASSLARDSAGVSVAVQKLRFRFGDTEPWVIDDVSFEVRAGESVAIVGPSGCGKTTLLKILLGLHEPQEGVVIINDKPLAQVGRRSWRSCIGTVMQDDVLFAGSIFDNIAFFDPTADISQVQEAARQASVDDEILAMPMGYDTLVGDMGSSVSGGQKQRILLARALFRRPRVLLLDEATSHLDLARERRVNEAIRRMPLTRIIIAHRPETISSADRVIVFDDGRIQQDFRQIRAVESTAHESEASSVSSS